MEDADIFILVFTDELLLDVKRSVKKFLFAAAGIMLLPLCIGETTSAFAVLRGSGISGVAAWAFLGGIGLYVMVHFFLHRPIKFHLYTHEITHVIWTWLFGGRVEQFDVSPQGGKVIVTKTNLLIRLAPYFFPLYAVLTVSVYGITAIFLGTHKWFPVCAALTGIALGFHIVMTLFSLKVKQTDLSVPGYIFSIPFIYSVNLAVIMFFVSIFFSNIRFMEFFANSVNRAIMILVFIFSLGGNEA